MPFDTQDWVAPGLTEEETQMLTPAAIRRLGQQIHLEPEEARMLAHLLMEAADEWELVQAQAGRAGLDALADGCGLTDEQVEDVRGVIRALHAGEVTAAEVQGAVEGGGLHEVAGLLRDLRRVSLLPDDDPERQVWLERKRDLLAQIEAGPGLAVEATCDSSLARYEAVPGSRRSGMTLAGE